MKFKYFLRGLGIGILFASIIFLAAYQGNSSNKMTDAEIIERAKELGMIEKEGPLKGLLDSEDTETQKQESSTEEKKTEQGGTDANSTEQSTENTTDENTSEEQSQQDVTKNTTEADPSVQDKKKDTVTLTIAGGDSSYPVCQRLQDLGMIENAEEFDTYLVEQGYASRIRVGTHTLNKGMSFYEIAEAISDPL